MKKTSKNFTDFLIPTTSKNELLAKAINGIHFRNYYGKIHTS